jgi:hypothetical protein
MIHRKILMAGAMVASLGTTACSDMTAPKNQASSSVAALGREVTFTKWFTTPPAMTGNTSYGPGTFAGTILKRTPYDNGVIVKLEAEYVVTDPSGRNSFTAHIQGTENLQTLNAVLNGVVTQGSMTGARVHVEFRVISPCLIVPKPVCFQGTIRIQG